MLSLVCSSRAWSRSDRRSPFDAPAARRSPALALSLALLAVFAVLIVAPGWVATQSPYAVDLARALQPPSAAHLFGTDDVGRDVFSRLVHGTRVTLGLVAGSLLLSALIGGVLGLVAGHAGGWFDLAAGRFADMILTFPPIIAGVVTWLVGSCLPTASYVIMGIFPTHLAALGCLWALVEFSIASIAGAWLYKENA